MFDTEGQYEYYSDLDLLEILLQNLQYSKSLGCYAISWDKFYSLYRPGSISSRQRQIIPGLIQGAITFCNNNLAPIKRNET